MYFVISVENSAIARNIATTSMNVMGAVTGVEAAATKSITWGHDGRAGFVEGIDAAVEERKTRYLPEGVTAASSSHVLDYFHVGKNTKDSVPRSVLVSCSSASKEDADVDDAAPFVIPAEIIAKAGDEWIGRVRAYIFFLRCCFSPELVQGFTKYLFDRLAHASQWPLIWYLWHWKIRFGCSDGGSAASKSKKSWIKRQQLPNVDDMEPPMFNVSPLHRRPGVAASSSSVEVHQSVFRKRYGKINASQPLKAVGVKRFLSDKFEGLVSRMKIRGRKMVGFGSVFRYKDLDPI